MSNCPGLHCPGCGKGGGIGTIVLVVGGVIIFNWLKHSMHTIDHNVDDVVTFLEITLMVIAGIVATSIAGIITYKIRQNILENRSSKIVSNRPIAGAIENKYRRPTIFVTSETIKVERNK